jgi:hypothetical protein
LGGSRKNLIMIISHKFKFIFIKTIKTAGTSIEIALSKFCGPKDIITPISQEDEEIRHALGYRGSQNYLTPFLDYTRQDWAELLRKGKRSKRFYNHMSAQEIKPLLDQSIWDNYYKFCFVRNPWDRLISLYYYSYQSEPRPTITEFLTTKYPLLLRRRGYDLYTINGKVVVDRICRYEDLSEELETIRVKLGIPDKLELPKAKSGFRKDNRSYRDIINEEEKMKVNELCREEIALTGYQF